MQQVQSFLSDEKKIPFAQIINLFRSRAPRLPVPRVQEGLPAARGRAHRAVGRQGPLRRRLLRVHGRRAQGAERPRGQAGRLLAPHHGGRAPLPRRRPDRRSVRAVRNAPSDI